MSEFHITLIIAVFAGVILLIAFDLIDMALAALLGVCVLLALGALNSDDLLAAAVTAGGPVSLLFGGMVVAGMLARTGVFDWVGERFLVLTGGSGRRFLLLLVALVAPVCAFLPNATTVILVAPVVIRVARALKIDFVGPMILAAVVSNSAGMLTLVGDPATFLVGSSIGLTFADYLRTVSLGGLLAVLVIIPLLPVLMPGTWRLRVELPAVPPPAPIQLVAAQAVPEVGLAAGFTDWPAATLPVFVAMMFGATLGGNATLIGASANIVAGGICNAAGERLSFMRFARIGLPITLVQLTLGALYVLGLTWWLGLA